MYLTVQPTGGRGGAQEELTGRQEPMAGVGARHEA